MHTNALMRIHELVDWFARVFSHVFVLPFNSGADLLLHDSVCDTDSVDFCQEALGIQSYAHDRAFTFAPAAAEMPVRFDDNGFPG